MMLVIETQCYENYAWLEDGSLGTGPDAYWKAKGGSSYKVLGVPTNVDMDEVLNMVRGEIENKTDAYQEIIIGHGLEADDWMSEFEQDQLKWEGEITFPEPFIVYSDLCMA
jgi:hypothetical protein